ncbi:MAG: D-alanyl-D-alanine carboxypeptidase family protein [Pseudomonadota bacterium]
MDWSKAVERLRGIGEGYIMVMCRRISGLAALACVLFAVTATPAAANSKYAAFVMHAHSGDILFDRYSNARRHPASLTKMMTLYMLFEELEAGRLTLNSKLKVSPRAAGQPPSKLGVRSGGTITVETAIKALVVKSANDVAVVVAEAIAGSEWRFATKMTQKARAIGMRRTTFRNASGLPNRKQVTTARDMARLAQRLMGDHRRYWSYFSTKSFTYNGRTYRTHNSLVRSFAGADGVKTGYTRSSGYNLTTSAKRDGHHLIGVVLGGRSSRTRDAHMRKILSSAFGKIKANPTQIAALHRKTPSPRVKPTGSTTLIAEAATDLSPRVKPTLLAAAPASADTLGALIAANGASTGSDVSLEELNASELGRLAAFVAGDEGLGQGDVEPDLFWDVQIGAYASKAFAQKELEAAALAAGLTDRQRSVSPFTAKTGATLHRARFSKFSEAEAEEACEALKKRAIACFAIKRGGAG